MEKVNVETVNSKDSKHHLKKIFLDLFEIFGNIISGNIISRICCDCRWNFGICVQTLIKYIEDNKDSFVNSVSTYQPIGNMAQKKKNLILYDDTFCERKKGAIPKNHRMLYEETTTDIVSTVNPKSKYLFTLHSQTQHDFQYLPDLETVINHINSGHKIMIIMRGAPGSGKSYLAKKIIDLTIRGDYKEFIHSTDNYFYNSSDKYCYNPQSLTDAHEYNQKIVRKKAMEGWSPIIVDNTNAKIWEMLPYVRIAIQNSYLVEIMQPNTPWCNSAIKLSKKNVHRVPKKKIENFLNNFEPINKNNIVEMIKTDSYSVPLPQMCCKPNIPFHLDIDSENILHNSISSTTKMETLIDLNMDMFKEDNKNDKAPKTPQFSKSSIIGNLNSKEHDYESMQKLEMHALNCPNGNKSFNTICQIYPNINVCELWDLFVKCNGVADCLINILYNDNLCPKINIEYQNTNTFFKCNCDPTNKNFNESILPNESDMNLNRKISNNNYMQNQDQNLLVSDISRTIENLSILSEPQNIDEEFQLHKFNEKIGSDADVGNDLYEFNLGKEFIKQLESIFALDSKLKVPLTNCHTNIFMPKSLAKQLYDLWIESLYNQIEEQKHITMKEDEAFAKFLEIYLIESGNLDVDVADNIELAWFKYNSDEPSNNSTRETLEYYSHLMKLFHAFPQIERDNIIEIFQAHGNRFDESLMVLNNSVNRDYNKLNILKSKNETYSEQTKRKALRNFEESRNHAAHHSQLKAECFEKAKDAVKRNSTSVAVYYSHIANFHNTNIDMCNQKAANCIMEVNDWKQNNSDFIDLHYLHTMEAIESLDLFLDKHINKLKCITRIYKYIFIITGRGLHSAGGISTIKNKVKTRLKVRNLKWSEVNPGLLKVKLYSSSKFSHNC